MWMYPVIYISPRNAYWKYHLDPYENRTEKEIEDKRRKFVLADFEENVSRGSVNIF